MGLNEYIYIKKNFKTALPVLATRGGTRMTDRHKIIFATGNGYFHFSRQRQYSRSVNPFLTTPRRKSSIYCSYTLVSSKMAFVS